MTTRSFARSPLLLVAVTMSVLLPARVSAHCDGLDGPVVTSARAALEARNVALVAIWVQPQDEPEIRRAFEQTLVVRSLSPQAKELADRFFFETVVRVHRAGEGAPFTGLKPAGRDLGPAIPAVDKALEERSLEPLVTLLTDTMRDRLRQHFNNAVTARTYDVGDVAAGREYVRAYVEFIHYVERLYDTSTTAAHGHFEETGAIQRHHR
ncbi:MAG: DUF6448 family protein [Vicinamibacterales bacterium]